MINAFKENAAQVGATVHVVDPGEVGREIREILEDKEAEGVVVSPSEEFDDVLGHDYPVSIVDVSRGGPDIGERSKAIKAADVGITRANLGIADLGVIGLELTQANESIASLAPDTHIALMREDDIYGGSENVFEFLGDAFREGRDDWVFIAGPSSTADMGALVQGVHGPGDVHVIVERTEEGGNDE
ncbi:MAG: LUD domain-containing protein [Halobacteria archaeon]|nr:LUD domain-containing protein [Halobacteria archaeon]